MHVTAGCNVLCFVSCVGSPGWAPQAHEHASRAHSLLPLSFPLLPGHVRGPCQTRVPCGPTSVSAVHDTAATGLFDFSFLFPSPSHPFGLLSPLLIYSSLPTMQRSLCHCHLSYLGGWREWAASGCLIASTRSLVNLSHCAAIYQMFTLASMSWREKYSLLLLTPSLLLSLSLHLPLCDTQEYLLLHSLMPMLSLCLTSVSGQAEG